MSIGDLTEDTAILQIFEGKNPPFILAHIGTLENVNDAIGVALSLLELLSLLAPQLLPCKG